MHSFRTTFLALGCSVLATSAYAQQASDGVVKIGILNDQSGVYADFGGKCSVEAARMAVAGFRRQGSGRPDRDRHRRPPEQARHRLQHRAPVVRRREGRRDHGADDLLGRARRPGHCRRKRRRSTSSPARRPPSSPASSARPYGFHWAYDTHALAVGTGGALVENGGNTWFFLTADYAFGYSLEGETSKFVKSKGGQVLGSVRHPLATNDFSSFLLQAQASGAKVVGLANAGLDTANSIKQAAEFGIIAGRPAARRPALHPRRSPRPRPQGRAGPDPDGGLVLGPERREPGLRQALPGEDQADAQHDPDRHLLGRDPVPEGGPDGRHGRRRSRSPRSCTRCRSRTSSPRTARCRPTAAWSTTCTSSR